MGLPNLEDNITISSFKREKLHNNLLAGTQIQYGDHGEKKQ